MQAVSWSPELHSNIRLIKKVNTHDVISFIASLSQTKLERKATEEVFTSSSKTESTTLGIWM